MTIIDKNNYEAYVLDYLEGTISSDDKERLLLFLENYPELKSALDCDISITIQTENASSFNFKDSLLKHPADEYELPIKDYLLIKESEQGLDKSEEQELSILLSSKTEDAAANKVYHTLKLKADNNIIYKGKAKLKRVVLLPLFKQVVFARSAAAIALVAVLLTLVFWPSNNVNAPIIANDNDALKKEVLKDLADAKIVEKSITQKAKPSKDSLLQLSNNPMEHKKQEKPISQGENIAEGKFSLIAGISDINLAKQKPINAYEHGLNVMMPQYMDNNILSRELAEIYKKMDVEDEPSLSLALVERGVKVMNFFSKDNVEMQKYYNDDGELIGYRVKGDNLELNRRAR